jgi:hypothetical protein
MTFQTLPWRDAVLSGFRLVNRRPVAALSWALVFFLGGTVMAGLQVWAWRGVEAGQGLSSAAVKLSFAGLAVNALIGAAACAAILRATVRSDARHAAWPRFGGDELRLLAFAPPIALLSLTIAAPIGLLFGQMATPGPLPMRLATWLSTAVLTLVGARLVLAAPMTIADRRLRLGGALGLSRGLHARLATIFVSALLLSMAIEWTGSWVRDAAVGALGADQAPVLRAPSLAAALDAAFGPAATASRLFGTLVHALALAVQVAPIGYAFRRLTDGREDPAAVFD